MSEIKETRAPVAVPTMSEDEIREAFMAGVMDRLHNHATITEEDLHDLITENPGFEGLDPGDSLPAVANLILVRNVTELPEPPDHGEIGHRGVSILIPAAAQTREAMAAIVETKADRVEHCLVMTATFYAARAPRRDRVDIYLVNVRAGHAADTVPGMFQMAVEYEMALVNH
jgi:hypothetical protein